MGCCSSGFSEYSSIAKENPKLASWMGEFKALALTDQAIYKFWQTFKKIDLDGSGAIEIVEMLVYFDIERTQFTKRVFGVFDEDGSGEIDLREFILALWNYCTLGKATLVIFAFDLYDKDGSGIIDSDELGLMLKEVYGSQYEMNSYAKRILESIRGLMCDAIDIDSFRKFVKKHPALLFPAFDVQRKMQEHTLGKRFWASLTNKRLKLTSGQYVPIKKYMELHLDQMVREDKERIKNANEKALEMKDKANGGTGVRRNSKERRQSRDMSADPIQIQGLPPDNRRNTKERRKSRDTSVDEKEPDDHVKDAMAVMAAASVGVQMAPAPTPDRSATKGRSSTERSSTKDRNSVKAERKEALRRKTIDAISQHPNLLQSSPATQNVESMTRNSPNDTGATLKSVEKAAARQRRKSTMNAALPSQRNGEDVPDIYSALLALSKDVGDKHGENRMSNFDKLLSKHARINPA